MNTVIIEGVEVFREGTWREHTYEGFDLSSMASGFMYLEPSVPVTLSHGGPLVGSVTAMHCEGDRLLANLEVDAETYERIKAGELHAVSIGTGFDGGHVVTEVALLGQGEAAYCEGLRPLGESVAAD